MMKYQKTMRFLEFLISVFKFVFCAALENEINVCLVTIGDHHYIMSAKGLGGWAFGALGNLGYFL